jgi:hypothetical protein
MTSLTIDADLAALLEHGAAVVKVARGDKLPLGKAWNTLATTIADVIGQWLGQGYNLGILLGHGNLIDVEFDDEAGRQWLAAGDLPPCGWRKIGGAEIRIGGKPAQSVLPPSRHPSGRQYTWLVSPQQIGPASITLAELGL